MTLFASIRYILAWADADIRLPIFILVTLLIFTASFQHSTVTL